MRKKIHYIIAWSILTQTEILSNMKSIMICMTEMKLTTKMEIKKVMRNKMTCTIGQTSTIEMETRQVIKSEMSCIKDMMCTTAIII